MGAECIRPAPAGVYAFECSDSLETLTGLTVSLPAGTPYTITLRRFKRDPTLHELQLELKRSEDGSIYLDEEGNPSWEYDEYTVELVAGNTIGILMTEQILLLPCLPAESDQGDKD